MTDFLRGAFHLLGQYRPVAEPLSELLRSSGENRILDLGSGAGGPWPGLLRHLDRIRRADEDPVTVTLTDLYPNRGALGRIEASDPSRFRAEERPVDARSVPPDLAGVRTVFTAFHHFDPEDARAVLADAAASGSPVAVVEVTQRRFLALLVLAVGVVPLSLLLTPFLRPFRLSRLLWTFPIPIAPFAAAWDGLVSCLRSYRPEELLALAREASGPEWDWRVEEVRYWRGWSPVPLTILVGRPTDGARSPQR